MSFSRKIHSQMDNIEEHMDWFAYRNPFIKPEQGIPGLWALDEKDEISGEYILNPVEFYYKDKLYAGFWGYDFYVEENYRAKGVGGWLLIRVLKRYRPFWGVGLTKMVIPLYAKAGVETLGYYRKFLWLNKPVAAVMHFLQRHHPTRLSQEHVWPSKININNKEFKRLEKFPHSQYKPYYDKDVVSFSRSAGFLDWRFFKSHRTYHFYFCETDPALYFVVRKVKYFGLDLLLIVDLKFPGEHPDSGQAILKASQSIAKSVNADGVITISSHLSLDRVLQKAQFFSVGKPAPIVSTLLNTCDDFKNKKVDIHLSMADSDLDLNFGALA